MATGIHCPTVVPEHGEFVIVCTAPPVVEDAKVSGVSARQMSVEPSVSMNVPALLLVH